MMEKVITGKWKGLLKGMRGLLRVLEMFVSLSVAIASSALRLMLPFTLSGCSAVHVNCVSKMESVAPMRCLR